MCANGWIRIAAEIYLEGKVYGEGSQKLTCRLTFLIDSSVVTFTYYCHSPTSTLLLRLTPAVLVR